MNRSLLVLTTCLTLCFVAAPGHAFWAWMHNAALNDFTDSDWQVLKAEARRALTDGADGAQVDWSNPETGSGGAIKLLATTEYEGQTCRRAAFRQFTASGLKGQGVYYLCQQSDATWKFVAESAIAAAAAAQR